MQTKNRKDKNKNLRGYDGGPAEGSSVMNKRANIFLFEHLNNKL